MRFAGSRLEGFLGDAPDMGAVAQTASDIRSKENSATTEAMSNTAAAGVTGQAKAKAAGIRGAANSALASAQGNAAMFETIGQIGGAAIGQFGQNSYFGQGREKYGEMTGPTDDLRRAGFNI